MTTTPFEIMRSMLAHITSWSLPVRGSTLRVKPPEREIGFLVYVPEIGLPVLLNWACRALPQVKHVAAMWSRLTFNNETI